MCRRFSTAVILLLAVVLLTTQPQKVQGQEKTSSFNMEGIFMRGVFNERSVWGMRSLKDGEHFTKKERDEKGNTDIVQYAFRTGEKTITIFEGESLLPEDSLEPLGYGSYTFSNDESLILMSTESERIYRHSVRANYYIWDRNKQQLSPLSVSGKQRYPAISPDNSKIAFIRDNNIFIHHVASNREQQVTFDGKYNEVINGGTDWVYEEEFGFRRAFFWSPDSRTIAFYRFDERNVKMFTMPIYNALYPEQYTFKYPKSGEENAKVTIHLFDVASAKTTQVELGKDYEYIPRIKWTKDANKLSILGMNRHQNKLDLLVTEVNSKKTYVVLSETSDTYISISDDLTFLDNGIEFIWTSEKSGFNHVYLYSLQGKQIRQVTKGKWEVTSLYGVDEANGTIFYQSTEPGSLNRGVYSIGITGKKKRKLLVNDGSNSARFTRSFDLFVGSYSNANTPQTVAVYTRDGSQLRVLEDNSKLIKQLEELGERKKDFIGIPGADGTELNAWIIRPPNFDTNKKYPVLMYVYGGPGSQTVSNSWDGRGYVWYHYLASKGYIVVSVDNRGTGGRGAKFKKQTYQNLGIQETEDQIAAAKWLGQQPWIDKDRIGIWGWSYGGYMSSLCITKGADVFKTAIAVAPVTNWKFYDTIYTERFMRTPEENPDGYKNGSPIHYADMLKGNYLIIHGTADDNVHWQNSAEMVEALVNEGKQFDMAIYPNKKHGISGAKTRLQLYTKMTNYILENL